MSLEEMVARIRAGGAKAAVLQFLNANPEVTVEQLAMSALQWGMDDVTEAVLLVFLDDKPAEMGIRERLAMLLHHQERYADAAPHFQILCEHAPADPVFASCLCLGLFARGDLEGLRTAIATAQRHIPDGRHLCWQAGVQPEAWFRGNLGPPMRAEFIRRVDEERARRLAPSTGAIHPRPHAGPTTGASDVAVCESGGGVEIGRCGAILSGRVASMAERADFRFEYGIDPDALTLATPWRPLPGRAIARLTASPHVAPEMFKIYAGHLNWVPEGCILADWPFGKDPNHISGVGFCELVFGQWNNSGQPDGSQEIQPWEGSDLRGAEYRLRLRIEEFEERDFLHCLGVGRNGNYWMLTSEPMDLSQLNGEAEIVFRLDGDPRNWSTFGNNPDEQANFDRYKYGPLDDTLGRHTGNLVFMAPFGDWRDTPTGRLGIRSSVLTYRDNNILNPDAGTRLVEAPKAFACDPWRLTDGIRGELSSGWYQCGSGEVPRFVWQLTQPKQVTSIILHQDPVMPTKRCRVALSNSRQASEGGPSFDVEWPALPTHTVAVPRISIRVTGNSKWDRITLELTEPAESCGIGLHAVEAFAVDHVPPPSRLPVTVSADVSGLPEGSRVYYRLQCHADGETLSGEVRCLDLPPDDRPLLHHVSIHHRSEDKICFQVFANALGSQAVLRWCLDDGDWRDIPLGWEKTPVHRYITLRGLAPVDHILKVKLVSNMGESPVRTVAWR